MPLHIAIIAGESSGDLLGAGLIKALKKRQPDLIVEGIAGAKMEQEGCHVLYKMDELATMGFIGPLKRLPRLLKIRRFIKNRWLKNPPDIFIGIDAPDFNLGLEKILRRAGICVVHYVSPSVWAWRQKRIYKIKKAVDLMLTLLPFEVDFYKQHNVPVKFVGHPLADQISENIDQEKAREILQLCSDIPVLAILPGSRKMEIEYLAEDFIRTVQWCLRQRQDLQLIAGMVDEERCRQFSSILERIAPGLPIKIIAGKSHQVMAAADVLLLASGTVTLEAALLQKPMVVAYRLSNLAFWLLKRLVKIDYVALPNLIVGRELVPEFLQDDAVPEKLGPAIFSQLTMDKTDLKKSYKKIRKELQHNANENAADAILDLLLKRKIRL